MSNHVLIQHVAAADQHHLCCLGADGTMPKLSTVVLYLTDDLHGTLPAGSASMPLTRLNISNTQLCNPVSAVAQPVGNTAFSVECITSGLPSCEQLTHLHQSRFIQLVLRAVVLLINNGAVVSAAWTNSFAQMSIPLLHACIVRKAAQRFTVA